MSLYTYIQILIHVYCIFTYVYIYIDILSHILSGIYSDILFWHLHFLDLESLLLSIQPLTTSSLGVVIPTFLLMLTNNLGARFEMAKNPNSGCDMMCVYIYIYTHINMYIYIYTHKKYV